MKTLMLIVGVLTVVVIILILKNGSFFDGGPDQASTIDKGNLIVYGSKGCPWCVKQEDWLTKSGIDYTFVDCTKSACPDFVNGFPTLLLDNKVMNGYTELGPDLSYPSPAKTELPF